jgi:HSP20 family protein
MAEKESRPATRPWDPFRELDLLADWNPLRSSSMLRALDERGPRWSPSMDIAENDDQFTVTVELAGAKKDDVTVEVHENVVTIRGEKRSEREEEKEQQRYVERTFGSFARSFSLPPNANGDAIRASFADGVLTVEIPKREEKKPKTISVK